jgi:ABC-2 type transport system permease protein
MSTIWTVTKRELKSYFDSILAYILIIILLLVAGLFTWFFGPSHIFLTKEASLLPFFSILNIILFLISPALTMKLLADEKSTGTLEVILSKPVSDFQLILGKYLAALILVLSALSLTLIYYITVASIGPIDNGATIMGYIGAILMSASYISVGIFASSLTNNQIISFLLALFIGAFLILLKFFAQYFPGTLGNIMSYLSISSHYESLTRGVIDSKDIVYFLSFIFMGLFGAEMVISKRNLTD